MNVVLVEYIVDFVSIHAGRILLRPYLTTRNNSTAMASKQKVVQLVRNRKEMLLHMRQKERE